MRTIPNKELRLPNGAHGAPYIVFHNTLRREKEFSFVAFIQTPSG